MLNNLVLYFKGFIGSLLQGKTYVLIHIIYIISESIFIFFNMLSHPQFYAFLMHFHFYVYYFLTSLWPLHLHGLMRIKLHGFMRIKLSIYHSQQHAIVFKWQSKYHFSSKQTYFAEPTFLIFLFNWNITKYPSLDINQNTNNL